MWCHKCERSNANSSASIFIGVSIVLMLIVGCKPAPTPYTWSLPEGIPAPHIPDDNPMTEESVALGRKLFYDAQLSGNGQQSCATCHQQQRAFTDGSRHSVGSTGQVTKRNSMALVNIAYNTDFTWAHNGLSRLEQQIMIPLFSETPVEMGASEFSDEILARINTRDYRSMFAKAYGNETPNWNNTVKALANFVRSLVSFHSPFDDYAYAQNDSALSPQAIEGLDLFFSERLECFHCHGGVNFSQSSLHVGQSIVLNSFHNTGLYNEDGKGAYPSTDRGLYDITRRQEDMGKFRAPTLRNIALTSPYMHDGSIRTLEEVLDFYASGGREAGVISPIKSPFLKGFTLSKSERKAMIAFLESLTDEQFIDNKRFGPPVQPN